MCTGMPWKQRLGNNTWTVYFNCRYVISERGQARQRAREKGRHADDDEDTKNNDSTYADARASKDEDPHEETNADNCKDKNRKY